MDESEMEELNSLMENIISDNTVPRNIKRAVTEAKERITHIKNIEVDLTSAIYSLDEAINDINMPFHTRTEVMSIISELERVKEQEK